MAPYETAHQRWLAVTARAKEADGHFVYAVKSTGIYCRPTCAARLARRANVDFYRRPGEAQEAGYRACKRCKPDIEGPEHDTQEQAVRLACDVIARHARECDANSEGSPVVASSSTSTTYLPAAPKTLGLKELAHEVGKTPRYLHKIFKDRMGVTPKQYEEQMREMYRPRLSVGSASGSASTGFAAPTTEQTSEVEPGAAFPFEFFNLDMDFDPEMLGPTERMDTGDDFAVGALSDLLTDGCPSSNDGSLTATITPNDAVRELPSTPPGSSPAEAYATSPMTPKLVEDFVEGTIGGLTSWEGFVKDYCSDEFLSRIETQWCEEFRPPALPPALSI